MAAALEGGQQNRRTAQAVIRELNNFMTSLLTNTETIERTRVKSSNARKETTRIGLSRLISTYIPKDIIPTLCRGAKASEGSTQPHRHDDVEEWPVDLQDARA